MAIQNTGYQRATELKIKQGSNERVYSLLDGFSIEKEVTAVKYGFLYNWWATQDQGGGVNIIPAAMASEGWAVPTDANIYTLENYVDVTINNPAATGYRGTDAAELLKSISGWDSSGNGTNEYQFNLLPSGLRSGNDGTFGSLVNSNVIWSSTQVLTTFGWMRRVISTLDTIERDSFNKKWGFSIRLARPATAAEQLLPDGEIDATYAGNDGKIYRCTKIGTQVWIADNLAETKWSDGSWIAGYDGGTYTPITDANWEALTTAALCAYDDDESNVLI